MTWISGLDDLEKNLVPIATQARVQKLESENRIPAIQEKRVTDPHSGLEGAFLSQEKTMGFAMNCFV